MSIYQCRLKPIRIAEEVWRRWVIPVRYSTRDVDYQIHVEGKKDINIPSYQADELEKLFPDFNFDRCQLEVGCGTGEFSINAAASNPEMYFIAIDVALPCVQRAVQKAEKLELKNLLFYSGLVDDFLFHDFKEIAIHSVMVNFPDPWPKKKHIKRRIVNLKFVDQCFQMLVPGGVLYTATDVEKLHQYNLEILEEYGRFKDTISDKTKPPNPLYEFHSKYQEKNLAKTPKNFYTAYRKN